MDQGELERRLWDAANCLRGPVDPSDFKAYVFPLLFLKRISDTWNAEHARAMDDYDDNETLAELPENYRFQLPDGCHWSDLRRASENVGVRLQTFLDRIQQANPDTLAGIFGTVAWGDTERLPEHALVNLITVFDSLDLSPAEVGNDLLGAAYEYLLHQFADASGKKAGEFFTPRSVVRLLTRILEPRAGDSIYDPAVGSAGMLVEALNEVRECGGDTRTMRLYGQEANLTTAAIARMNLYLHDIEDFRIMRGDTLREPKFHDDRGQLTRFSCVLANPPFSLKNWGQETWVHDPYGRAFCGAPPAGNGDFAWIPHMVRSMETGTGRVGVVMPHGVLFRGGQETPIRQCLIESDQLEAVIGLPPNLFYSTTIPALYIEFAGTLVTALARFDGIDRADSGFAALLAAQERLKEPGDKDAFAREFVTCQGLFEFLWPDSALRPYEADYRWLAKIYDSVAPTGVSDKLLWLRLGAKTHELIAANVTGVRIDVSGLEEVVLDAHTVEVIGQLELLTLGAERPDPPTAAEVLDTLAGRLARRLATKKHPVYESLARRLDDLRQAKLREASASVDFLKMLLELARDVVAAERADDAGDIDAIPLLPDPHKGALTQIFLEVKPDATPEIVDKVVDEIDTIVRQVRFTGWQVSTPGDKEVRRQLRMVLKNHGLDPVGPLFDRAYAYIAQNY